MDNCLKFTKQLVILPWINSTLIKYYGGHNSIYSVIHIFMLLTKNERGPSFVEKGEKRDNCPDIWKLFGMYWNESDFSGYAVHQERTAFVRHRHGDHELAVCHRAIGGFPNCRPAV